MAGQNFTKKNQFIKQGTLNFLTFFSLFCWEKKLAKLRKLHHDKTIKLDFFALLFENDTLGYKIYTFLHSWQAKKCKFYTLWHHFKSRAKKSHLYLCHEIVFFLLYWPEHGVENGRNLQPDRPFRNLIASISSAGEL